MQRRQSAGYLHSTRPTWWLHPEVSRTAAWLLKMALPTLKGKVQFPTHGFTTVVFALAVCHEVRLYGFEEKRGETAKNWHRNRTKAGVQQLVWASDRKGTKSTWTGHEMFAEHHVLEMLAAPEHSATPPAIRSWFNQFEHAPALVYHRTGGGDGHGSMRTG